MSASLRKSRKNGFISAVRGAMAALKLQKKFRTRKKSESFLANSRSGPVIFADIAKKSNLNPINQHSASAILFKNFNNNNKLWGHQITSFLGPREIITAEELLRMSSSFKDRPFVILKDGVVDQRLSRNDNLRVITEDTSLDRLNKFISFSEDFTYPKRYHLTYSSGNRVENRRFAETSGLEFLFPNYKENITPRLYTDIF